MVTVQAHVLSTLTSVLPTFQLDQHFWPHLANLGLADPEFYKPRPIDIIIGADFYGQIIKPNIIKGSPSQPMAQHSIFGWLILGPARPSQSATLKALHATAQPEQCELQNLLTKFWHQEEVPEEDSTSLSPDEMECEEHFRTTHARDNSGRYIVRLPLKLSVNVLGHSHEAAQHSLQRVLRRFKKDAQYEQLYRKFMTEYEQLGHMVKAPITSNSDDSLYYLPHHGVLKPDSTTTKLRVVFNGSCPSTSGYSINDLMHTGANLLLNITDVLLWIRHHRHLFATDITKMYRMIKVHQEDWNLQRILWMDDKHSEVPYQLTTVTYGLKAAPFLAVRTLLQLTEDEGHRFPLAVPCIKQGRYVDDIFGGADTVHQLIQITQHLKGLCNAGGFPLAKWHSTHPDVLSAVSPEQSSTATISLDDCNTKILGLHWNPHTDRFGFSSHATALSSHSISKRMIASEVAQIFDPLGFISPVVIRAKMLLQELWLHKLNWDDPLPSQVCTRWLTIKEDLTSLRKLSIPRWLNTWTSSTVELHGFADASQLAMAAVIYIIVQSPSTKTATSLVCSKTKVAPLKRLTIPRLELSAALLLAKLMKYVQATLQVDVKATHLWTDSQVTLTWIKSHASRWKDFVRNRVTQIQELNPDAQWRHVPGSSNPADCASRGMTTAQLESHDLWWTGPPWLTDSSESWPTQPPINDDASALEARPGISLLAVTSAPEYHWDLIYKYSNLTKLFRITALCYRIADRMRRTLGSRQESVTRVHPSDLQRAKVFWIKATQAAYFHQELKTLNTQGTFSKNHPFSRLTAFLDAQGVIRVGGRLHLSDLSFETKHPAILPRHSQLSNLIIAHAHEFTLHGGTQLTLAHTRRSYWILGGRAPVKSHILRCITCARQRGIRAHQLMGQLPLSRVAPSRPFSHTGVDYAGPLTIKAWKGRGGKPHKGWMCVFVCFSTSAVHLEAVTDYSTEGFIAALRRFSSRRGTPHTLYSDCGTNFVGADVALKRLFNRGSQEQAHLETALSSEQIQWTFNPPAAPHMGGKWEAVVKSIKHHLRRAIRDTVLTFEELTTLLSQIEAILNSRPLEPLSDDPDDVSALTPGHFLIGGALLAPPEPSLLDLAESRLSRWQLIQQRMQQFWVQWSSQYLHQLQSISKWHSPAFQIKLGSLVLLTDERLPPSKWPLARVTALHPGKDGLTRVVTLKTANSSLTRPITKLAVLPVYASDNSGTTHQPTG